MSVEGFDPHISDQFKSGEAPDGIENTHITIDTGKGYGSRRFKRINLKALREIASSSCHGGAVRDIDALCNKLKVNATKGYLRIDCKRDCKLNRSHVHGGSKGRGADKCKIKDDVRASFQDLFNRVRDYAAEAPKKMSSVFVNRGDVKLLVSEYDRLLGAMTENTEALRESAEGLQAAQEELGELKAQHSDTLAEFSKAKETYRADLRSKVDDMGLQEKEISGLKGENLRLSSDLANLQALYDTEVHSHEESKQLIADLQIRLGSAEAALPILQDMAMAEMGKIAAKLAPLQGKIERLEGKVKALQEEIEALNNKFVQSNLTHTLELGALNANLVASKAKVSEQSDKILELTTGSRDLQRSFEKEKVETARLRIDVSDLTTANRKLTEELDSVRTQVESAVRDKESTVLKKDEELATASARIETIKARLEEAGKSLATRSRTTFSLAAKCTVLKKQLAQARDDITIVMTAASATVKRAVTEKLEDVAEVSERLQVSEARVQKKTEKVRVLEEQAAELESDFGRERKTLVDEFSRIKEKWLL